jgi:hypothetical protein
MDDFPKFPVGGTTGAKCIRLTFDVSAYCVPKTGPAVFLGAIQWSVEKCAPAPAAGGWKVQMPKSPETPSVPPGTDAAIQRFRATHAEGCPDQLTPR